MLCEVEQWIFTSLQQRPSKQNERIFSQHLCSCVSMSLPCPLHMSLLLHGGYPSYNWKKRDRMIIAAVNQRYWIKLMYMFGIEKNSKQSRGLCCCCCFDKENGNSFCRNAIGCQGDTNSQWLHSQRPSWEIIERRHHLAVICFMTCHMLFDVMLNAGLKR